MGKEMEFFIFLLENYAEYKNTTADEVLGSWDELKLTDFIYDMYERYHVERLENAFEDIDRLVEENRHSSHCRIDSYRKDNLCQN